MKSILGTLIVLLTILSFTGCNFFGGYQTTRYLDMHTNNPQERVLSIGRFAGEKTQEWEFAAATQIVVEYELEQGSIIIALYAPNGKELFEKEVTPEEVYKEIFQGEFSSGKYHKIMWKNIETCP
ncbi:MAG: hypothetical protein JJT76_06555 [Clostridiaceae bacterium]|nr:hypothetical protein [Clostridiaceae bacterium]